MCWMIRISSVCRRGLGALACLSLFAIDVSEASAQDSQTAAAPAPAARIPVTFAQPAVPVPLVIEKELVFFQARVGDTPVRVLLDNGADLSVIDAALAHRLGLATRPLNRPLNAVDGDQRPQVLAPEVPFTAPGQFVATTPMLVVDLAPVSTAFSRPVDVILGSEIFGSFAITVDKRSGTVGFRPRGTADTAGWVEAPFAADDSVQVEVAGQPLTLTLDLGSSGGAGLTEEVFARVLPGAETRPSEAITAFGGRQRQRMTDGTVKLGPVSIRGPISVADRSGLTAGVSGWLGAGLFQNYAVVFDRGTGKLFSRPPVDMQAAPENLTAAQVADRWTALMRRPSAEVMRSDELALLSGLFARTAAAYRSEILEARTAGRQPRACLPEHGEMSGDGIVADIRSLPTAEQQADFAIVFGRLFDRKYPCAQS